MSPCCTLSSVFNEQLAPADDPVVIAEIRFWTRDSAPIVFVRPDEYRKITVWGGVECWGNYLGTAFEVDLGPSGEFHRIGMMHGKRLVDFPGAVVGDFPVKIRVDWARALPEELLTALRFSPPHLAAWRALSCPEMREQLTHIRRARRPAVRTDRTLALVDRLGG